MLGYSHRKSRRAARHNPEEASLPKEAGMTVAASVVGIALSVGIEKLINGMKKGGEGADKDYAKYSNNQVSAITAGIGAVLGVGLHVKGIAPRVGKALIAGTGALAASRYAGHMSDLLGPDGKALTGAELTAKQAILDARLAGSRGFSGINVAPVMVSHGPTYGYLGSGGAVGAQYGTTASGGVVGAQYGTTYTG